MKRFIVLLLIVVLLFVSTGNVMAISFLEGNPPLTEADKTAAVSFFNGLKWDLTGAGAGTIKITLPKVPKSYNFFVLQVGVDQDGATLAGTGTELHNGSGGVTVTSSFPKTQRTMYVFTMGNIVNGRAISVEAYILGPGAKTMNHPDSATYRIPVKENGEIIEWINLAGKTVEFVKPSDPNSRFADLYTGHWALDVVNQLYDAGYIKGYPNGLFMPENNITRAEFMVMLGKLLGDQYPSGAVNEYAAGTIDYNTSHWSYDTVINTFKYLPGGDIRNIFGSDFNPNQYITREEVVASMASALANHHNFKGGNSSVSLSDLNSSNFPDAITFSVNNGLVRGYPDGTFKPQANITRAEIAAVMVRMIEKL